MRIQTLIAETDPIELGLMEAVLSSQRWPYHAYDNHEEAFEELRNNLYDLLILSDSGKQKESFEYVKEARALYGKEIVILLITEKSDIEYMEEAIEAGINDYIVRPVDLSLFTTRLANIETRIEKHHEIQRVQGELDNATAQYRALFDNSAVGVVVFNQDGVLLNVNMTLNLLTGFSELKTDEKFHLCCVHPDDQAASREFLQKVAEEKLSSAKMELRFMTRSQFLVWVEISASFVQSNHNTDNGFIILIINDITEKYNMINELKYLAYYDSHTSLPGRKMLITELEKRINTASETPFALLIINLDHFQRVNETLGHHRGDILIKLVAERFSRLVNEGAFLAKLSGDEFAFILDDHRDLNDITEFLSSIENTLKNPFSVVSNEINLTGSIGIREVTNPKESTHSILRDADIALHRAKKQGQNRHCFYTIEMGKDSIRQMQLEIQLRKALNNNELELYFQPQIDVATGLINGVEALIRWNHPDEGLLLPAEFIALAEESDLIVAVGHWVINEAVRLSYLWSEEGVSDLKIAINLAAPQFSDIHFMPLMNKILSQKELGKNLLQIELTENIFMTDLEHHSIVLNKLKKKGILFAIDDFGTGYSSMSYLRNLPIDCIKIDGSFISGISSSQSDFTIVSAIIAMSHALNMKVVAEGVETEEQYRLLEKLDCDLIQGFLVSRPVKSDQLIPLIRSYSRKVDKNNIRQ